MKLYPMFLAVGVLATSTSFADANSWNNYCNDYPYANGCPCYENPSCGGSFPGAYVMVPETFVIPDQTQVVETNSDNTTVDTNNAPHSYNGNNFNGGQAESFHGAASRR